MAVAHQLPQLTDLGWGDPGLGRLAEAQQVDEVGGVTLVVLHPPVAPVVAQRMGQVDPGAALGQEIGGPVSPECAWALLPHGFVDPKRRPRRRSHYKAGRGPELWSCCRWTSQAASPGPRHQASIVTGIDRLPRLLGSANVLAPATAKPVCDALAEAMELTACPKRLSSSTPLPTVVGHR